jgi:putative transposase
VPHRKRKRQRLGTSTCPADRLRAGRPHHVWALDFQFDQTSDGKILKLLDIVDEHTREELGGLVERRIDADRTVACLDDIVKRKGVAPEFIRCDNGPELTANALRDWCRFSGTGTSYIEPGSPWENPFVESFGSRLRDELLSVEQFDTLLEAQVLIGDWKHEYNNYRPHSSLGWMSPVAYAIACQEEKVDRLSNGGGRLATPLGKARHLAAAKEVCGPSSCSTSG